MLEKKEKEDIKEMFSDYGWSLRDLSEEYGMSIRDIKEIIGKTDTETNEEDEGISRKELFKQKRKEKQQKLDALREKTATINNFRAKGCALSRCPRCGEIMNNLVEDNEGQPHYSCDACGYNDLSDKACKSRCCRRGLYQILKKDPEIELEEEDHENLKEWIKEGEA